MNPLRSIIAIALSTLATSPLFAQLAPAKPAGGAVGGAMPAAAQSTTSAPPAQRDIDPKAKAIYDKAVSATKAAKTLTFTAELTMASNGPDTKAMMPAGIEGKTRFTVRFVDAKVPATAPAGGLPPLPSDSICVERLDGPNKGSVLVIHGGRVLRIDNARKTFSEGGAEHAMLAMMAMRMYPEWIHTFRESSNANEGQPEPISITLDGTKQVDGLECDVIKVVRQMQMVMGGVVMDGDDGAEGGDAGKSAVAPDVKTPETNPTVMSTETIVIARADGLPRQQTIKLVMAPPPGDAGEGMVIDGPGPGRITALDLKVNPTIADAVFTPKVPEGFTKAEPEVPGFAVAGADAPPQPQLAVKVGAAAPDFNLTNLDGNRVTLASLKGKVVLLDFWATWCGPCKAAMPTIQKLHAASMDKGVVILGVNTWEKSADAAKDYMARKKFTYGCLLNGDDLAKAYGLTGIPTLVIIGKDGMVAMADMGLSDDTGASLRKAIDAALAR